MRKNIKKIKNILLVLFIAITTFGFEDIYAATAKISVTSNTNQIVLGKEFTVTVKISSSVSLGTWEWVIDYNSKNFKLISGTSYVVDYASNGSKKSASYTYKFKAIGTGSGNISVKSAGAYDWDEKSLSISKNSKSIKVITQEQLEASYSKNNNLKSLSIDGLTLSPKFDKDTLEYKAEATANTTKIKINATKADSKASITGAGEKEVSEGENKFEIIVKAENGSSKIYTIIVNVIDPNPIKVTTVDNKELTIVKRGKNLEVPENFELTTITIDEQSIPALYNEINNITLVGLKNEEGLIELYIYNTKKNTFSKYYEITLDQVKIFPLKMDKEISNYETGTITIGDNVFEALLLKNSSQSIIHARSLLDGKENYYIYDEELNTLITYDGTLSKIYDKKIDKYLFIILLLCGESIIVFLILLFILISKVRKNKKRKKLIEEKKKKTLVKEHKDKKQDNKTDKEKKRRKDLK